MKSFYSGHESGFEKTSQFLFFEGFESEVQSHFTKEKTPPAETNNKGEDNPLGLQNNVMAAESTYVAPRQIDTNSFLDKKATAALNEINTLVFSFSKENPAIKERVEEYILTSLDENLGKFDIDASKVISQAEFGEYKQFLEQEIQALLTGSESKNLSFSYLDHFKDGDFIKAKQLAIGESNNGAVIDLLKSPGELTIEQIGARVELYNSLTAPGLDNDLNDWTSTGEESATRKQLKEITDSLLKISFDPTKKIKSFFEGWESDGGANYEFLSDDITQSEFIARLLQNSSTVNTAFSTGISDQTRTLAKINAKETPTEGEQQTKKYIQGAGRLRTFLQNFEKWAQTEEFDLDDALLPIYKDLDSESFINNESTRNAVKDKIGALIGDSDIRDKADWTWESGYAEGVTANNIMDSDLALAKVLRAMGKTEAAEESLYKAMQNPDAEGVKKKALSTVTDEISTSLENKTKDLAARGKLDSMLKGLKNPDGSLTPQYISVMENYDSVLADITIQLATQSAFKNYFNTDGVNPEDLGEMGKIYSDMTGRAGGWWNLSDETLATTQDAAIMVASMLLPPGGGMAIIEGLGTLGKLMTKFPKLIKIAKAMYKPTKVLGKGVFKGAMAVTENIVKAPLTAAVWSAKKAWVPTAKLIQTYGKVVTNGYGRIYKEFPTLAQKVVRPLIEKQLLVNTAHFTAMEGLLNYAVAGNGNISVDKLYGSFGNNLKMFAAFGVAGKFAPQFKALAKSSPKMAAMLKYTGEVTCDVSAVGTLMVIEKYIDEGEWTNEDWHALAEAGLMSALFRIAPRLISKKPKGIEEKGKDNSDSKNIHEKNNSIENFVKEISIGSIKYTPQQKAQIKTLFSRGKIGETLSFETGNKAERMSYEIKNISKEGVTIKQEYTSPSGTLGKYGQNFEIKLKRINNPKLKDIKKSGTKSVETNNFTETPLTNVKAGDIIQYEFSSTPGMPKTLFKMRVIEPLGKGKFKMKNMETGTMSKSVDISSVKTVKIQNMATGIAKDPSFNLVKTRITENAAKKRNIKQEKNDIKKQRKELLESQQKNTEKLREKGRTLDEKLSEAKTELKTAEARMKELNNIDNSKMKQAHEKIAELKTQKNELDSRLKNHESTPDQFDARIFNEGITIDGVTWKYTATPNAKKGGYDLALWSNKKTKPYSSSHSEGLTPGETGDGKALRKKFNELRNKWTTKQEAVKVDMEIKQAELADNIATEERLIENIKSANALDKAIIDGYNGAKGKIESIKTEITQNKTELSQAKESSEIRALNKQIRDLNREIINSALKKIPQSIRSVFEGIKRRIKGLTPREAVAETEKTIIKLPGFSGNAAKIAAALVAGMFISKSAGSATPSQEETDASSDETLSEEDYTELEEIINTIEFDNEAVQKVKDAQEKAELAAQKKITQEKAAARLALRDKKNKSFLSSVTFADVSSLHIKFEKSDSPYDKVIKIQKALIKHGQENNYSVDVGGVDGEADGWAGAKTIRALNAYKNRVTTPAKREAFNKQTPSIKNINITQKQSPILVNRNTSLEKTKKSDFDKEAQKMAESPSYHEFLNGTRDLTSYFKGKNFNKDEFFKKAKEFRSQKIKIRAKKLAKEGSPDLSRSTLKKEGFNWKERRLIRRQEKIERRQNNIEGDFTSTQSSQEVNGLELKNHPKEKYL